MSVMILMKNRSQRVRDRFQLGRRVAIFESLKFDATAAHLLNLNKTSEQASGPPRLVLIQQGVAFEVVFFVFCFSTFLFSRFSESSETVQRWRTQSDFANDQNLRVIDIKFLETKCSSVIVSVKLQLPAVCQFVQEIIPTEGLEISPKHMTSPPSPQKKTNIYKKSQAPSETSRLNIPTHHPRNKSNKQVPTSTH